MYAKIKELIMDFCNKNLNKTACTVAFIHFVISFFSDRVIFTYKLIDFSKSIMIAKMAIAWGCKILFLIVLFVFYNYIYYLLKKASKEYVKFVGIYFAMMIGLLLLTYPGIWRMDEFGLLFTASEAFFDFWQNYLTDLFYIMALMFCPIPASIVLMQCLVISIIVGSILYQIQCIGLIKGKWIYGLYLPFLCLPVLSSNLYPIRMSLYAYFELFMLVKMVLLKYKAEQGHELEFKDFWAFLIVVPIVLTLRSEAVYYFVAFPLCFAIFFKDRIARDVKWRVLWGILIVSVILFLPQQIGNKMRNGNKYALTSMVLPIVPLVHAANNELMTLNGVSQRNDKGVQKQKEELKQMLVDIDQVINVEMALEGFEKGKNGISLFWAETDFQRKYSDEEFQNFQKAYRRLILRYPQVFIKERMQTFLESCDLLEDTTSIYEDNGIKNHERFASLFGNKAISKNVRNDVICALELRESGDYLQKMKIYPVVYHVMIPLIYLTGLFIFLCIQRKGEYALLLSVHLCKVPLIILTAPSRLFMYYYPVYLVGVFTMGFCFILKCSNKKLPNTF